MLRDVVLRNAVLLAMRMSRLEGLPGGLLNGVWSSNGVVR